MARHTTAKPRPTIIIYTDDATSFQKVLGSPTDILYPVIAEEQWQQWKGSVNKVYLLKIGVLEHAATHFPGNLLFLDTDTIWLKDPAPIFEAITQGVRYMHLDEGTLAMGNGLSRKVYRHLKNFQTRIAGHTLRIEPTTRLFNSGVLGFRSEDAGLLPEVMQLAEQLYAAYNKHMMEQLAFSMRFAVEGQPVQEAAGCLLHYWNLKAIRPVLTELFERYAGQSYEELYQRATQLNIPWLHKSEQAYSSLPGWRRAIRKATGRRWQLPHFDL
ncbi:putative nucleotide-diphospho-sugar transferase [Hymenobacter sp. DG25A]|uniref:putative nucleotide-diphospho-sugar transferase n=1 Tax=Hymenobacter sp. DG25A TaxID=1385663 RepID=UPI0006BC9BBC|nr:putative nucleotide-diphospho-sugar transferase [Hymenobacter sp. DG25A]ALD20037.1 hypothetical protein AM218_00850 [Hymenobacter sp. DG25A]